MSLAQISNAAIALGGAIAIVSFIVGMKEYVRSGTLRRADDFLMLRRRLKENETFRRLCSLLASDDAGLQQEPYENKRDLVGLFEEVALMLNSGLLRKQVAHYMFGSYAIECYQSQNFWANMNLASPYWSVFRDFAERMLIEEKNFQFRPRDYRL